MSEEKYEHSTDWVQSVYRQGFEDGRERGRREKREHIETELGRHAMIGRAFCDWVGDDAAKVKNRDDVYDILDGINEGRKIVVGDEVMYGRSRAIVTRVYDESNTCNILLKEEINFGETIYTSVKGLKKTGTHYDIEKALK